MSMGRSVKPCKGSALEATLAGLMLATGILVASGQASLPTTSRPIQGTITRIDEPRLYFSVRTDDGRHADLAIANVDAIRTMRAGDHVRVESDGDGVALNISRTPSAPQPVSYPRG